MYIAIVSYQSLAMYNVYIATVDTSYNNKVVKLPSMFHIEVIHSLLPLDLWLKHFLQFLKFIFCVLFCVFAFSQCSLLSFYCFLVTIYS